MGFYILLMLLVVVPAGFIYLAFFCDLDEAGVAVVVVFGVIFSVLAALPVSAVISRHVGDVAVIQNQIILVEVYEEQIAELDDRLKLMEYPQSALLNADSPVSSIVATISEWQNKISQAKADRAEAIIAVEARRMGLFSGVITMFGDYK